MRHLNQSAQSAEIFIARNVHESLGNNFLIIQTVMNDEMMETEVPDVIP